MIQITAPSNLFAHGYHADALRGRHYLARMQNRFHSSVFDVHFSLDHDHPRTFRARVHRKDGSRHGDRAIRSTNIQVPGGPAKYQLRPIQTAAISTATAVAAKDSLTKLHWKPRAPGSICQPTVAAPSTPRPDAYERHETHSRR